MIATDGIGYHQIEGQPVEVLHPGDVALCPPGKKHWHGGSADTRFAHLAINTNPETGGLPRASEFLVEWLEPVSIDQPTPRQTTELVVLVRYLTQGTYPLIRGKPRGMYPSQTINDTVG